MSDYGLTMAAICCEVLHCTLSEYPNRCKEITDEEFAAAYLERKHDLGGSM